MVLVTVLYSFISVVAGQVVLILYVIGNYFVNSLFDLLEAGCLFHFAGISQQIHYRLLVGFLSPAQIVPVVLRYLRVFQQYYQRFLPKVDYPQLQQYQKWNV